MSFRISQSKLCKELGFDSSKETFIRGDNSIVILLEITPQKKAKHPSIETLHIPWFLRRWPGGFLIIWAIPTCSSWTGHFLKPSLHTTGALNCYQTPHDLIPQATPGRILVKHRLDYGGFNCSILQRQEKKTKDYYKGQYAIRCSGNYRGFVESFNCYRLSDV